MQRYLFLMILLILNCSAIHQANKYYEQGNYTQVIQHCLKTLETDSLNAEAHFLLGKSYYHQKKLDSAIQSLTRAWKIQPKTQITPLAKSALVQAHLDFADTLFHRGDDRKARDKLFTVLELDSINIPGLQKLGDYYYENGRLDKARALFQKAVRFDSANQSARSQLAQIQKRTALAEAKYQKGREKYQAYHYQSAAKILATALKHKPDHRDAQYYLALSKGCLLYRKGGQSKCWDAITEFGKCMMLRPESGEPHYFMALAYEKKDRNEYENAIEEYKIALEKEPDAWFAKHARKKIKALTRERDILKKFWGK